MAKRLLNSLAALCIYKPGRLSKQISIIQQAVQSNYSIKYKQSNIRWIVGSSLKEFSIIMKINIRTDVTPLKKNQRK